MRRWTRSGTEPRHSTGRSEAQRQFFGRGKRALPLSEDLLAGCSPRLPGAPDVRGSRGDTETYRRKFSEMGGIVEEFIEFPHRLPERPAPDQSAGRGRPALDPRPDPRRPRGPDVPRLPVPARESYRQEIQTPRCRIGEVLAGRGVVSRFGVDFFVGRRPETEWEIFALEINLRIGGTTHPFLALQFLTGGQPRRGDGRVSVAARLPPSSIARPTTSSPTRTAASPRRPDRHPDDQPAALQPRTETGVLFHLIGALSQFGKLGLTAIGNSPEQAERSTTARWPSSIARPGLRP